MTTRAEEVQPTCCSLAALPKTTFAVQKLKETRANTENHLQLIDSIEEAEATCIRQCPCGTHDCERFDLNAWIEFVFFVHLFFAFIRRSIDVDGSLLFES